MSFRMFAASALFLASAPAFAASDLTTSISAPSGTYVYQTGRYTVTVNNIGNQTANSATVTIALPRTGTSPQVYVMGTLGAKSAGCTTSGTNLVCTLGNIRARRSTSVYFDIALPESTSSLAITATAATTSSENSSTNNETTVVPSLSNYLVNFSGSAVVNNRHCTGTGLTSFFECELFPSSLSEHEATLNADGSISFPAEYGPEYGGTWFSDSDDYLSFSYTEFGVVIAEFEGWGVSANCWEGITTFVGSSYVSAYEVCL